MRFVPHRGLCFCLSLGALAALPRVAEARNTSLLQPHSGFLMGTQTYFKVFTHYNDFDPVPGLAPTGTTVADSDSLRQFPLKLGYFQDFAKFGFEVYGLAMFSLPARWTSTGGSAGTGTSKMGGWGVGAAARVALYSREAVRVSATASAEWLSQTYTLDWTPTAGTAERLLLNSHAKLFGVGLQNELWLGDLWSLVLGGGYRFGLRGNWGVSENGALFGQSYTAGTSALSPASGLAVTGDFGGFYVEGGFKLSFF